MNYALLEKSLATVNAEITPSEFHGLLTGFICTKPDVPFAYFKQRGLSFVTGDTPSEPANFALAACFDYIHDSLASLEYTYELMLGGGDESLTIRIERLRHWADGFMVGFALAEKQNNELSSTVQEGLEDMVAFTHLETPSIEDDVPSDPEDENHFMQCVEYLRMLAITFFNEHTVTDAPQVSDISTNDSPVNTHGDTKSNTQAVQRLFGGQS